MGMKEWVTNTCQSETEIGPGSVDCENRKWRDASATATCGHGYQPTRNELTCPQECCIVAHALLRAASALSRTRIATPLFSVPAMGGASWYSRRGRPRWLLLSTPG